VAGSSWVSAGIGTNAKRNGFPWAKKLNPGRPNEEDPINFSLHLRTRNTHRLRQTTQPTGGASSQGNVGPGASEGAMKDGAMKQGTTGTSSRPSAGGDASTSGAGTAAGANSTGTAKEPGAVQKGVNKQ
jgi:hypothetical protein